MQRYLDFDPKLTGTSVGALLAVILGDAAERLGTTLGPAGGYGLRRSDHRHRYLGGFEAALNERTREEVEAALHQKGDARAYVAKAVKGGGRGIGE